MKYKNIIFDIGGVLFSYRWFDIIMETVTDEEEARAFGRRIFQDPLWLEFDIGIRPFDDVVEDYVAKYPSDEEHIRYIFGHLERMPVPRPQIWEKMRRLKEKGYNIYLLSNYSERMLRKHTEGQPVFDSVDGGIISYKVHQLKPHKEIYESLLSEYDLDPAECLFFDDRQDNVDGGRKCGIDGRVIYSEEVLSGYLDRLLSDDGISNIFHDPGIPREERINRLLSEMTLEEKITLYSHPERGVGRLGVEGFVLGGEAAHGVEARNEQNGINTPDKTTSFPNPIGMSSSWDTGLIYKAGSVVGDEARACWKRHRKTGLSRWAPTVDPERDPRWGRNEEGYGEDPLLTSVNAVSYIRGMQGNDPEYIKCGATLKHFYANNREADRFFSNSSVGMRDKFEYYLPPFLAGIDEGKALGVMTAYNKINGVPGMTNPEVGKLLKGKHGLTHAVSDGFAMAKLKDFHREYGTLAECMAESVRAGVDSMSDKQEDVEKAVRDALELSFLSEAELDGALRNILMAEMKLGIYDPEGTCPYDGISAGDIDTGEAREICRRLSEEALVLLENKAAALPLDLKDAGNIALVGPLADEWYKDWYGGNPPFCHTVSDGLKALLNMDFPVTKGIDEYRIVSGDKAWHLEPDGKVTLASRAEGDTFYIEDWGEGYHTIRSTKTGKYVQILFYVASEDDKEILCADREDTLDWFVTCRFSISDAGNGNVRIKDRFNQPVSVTAEGRLKADDRLPEMQFSLEKTTDGTEEAIKAVSGKDCVILVLGCNPMVPAREDFDRTSLALPPGQQKLLEAMAGSGKKIITVLISNYPYIFNGMEKRTDALLLSASGSEYMGDAVAAALFGRTAPAGRLTQTWPVSCEVLPDITDYQIRGKRTYRYLTDGILYPFGYGLTYSEISYTGMTAGESGDGLKTEVTVNIRNNGPYVTDEVVQIYTTADFSDDKFGDYGYGRRLIGFTRVHDIKPGEEREIKLAIDKSRFQVFDVVLNDYMIYGGRYHIYAGRDALNEIVSCDITLKGQDFEARELSDLNPVYACDFYENIEFTKGHFGMTAASVREEGRTASLIFTKNHMPEKAKKVMLLLKSGTNGRVEIYWNENRIAGWEGNTVSPEKKLPLYELPSENTILPEGGPAAWSETECLIHDLNGASLTGKTEIRLFGDVKLLSMKYMAN